MLDKNNLSVIPMTRDIAQQHLDAWLSAELALAQAQSYMITTPSGQRQVTRANLAEVRRTITYWQNQVDGLNTPRSRFSKAQFSNE
jgi:hypothetical protein